MSKEWSECLYVALTYPVKRLITPTEMCQIKKISKTKLYLDIKSGVLPEPLRKGNKTLGWTDYD